MIFTVQPVAPDLLGFSLDANESVSPTAAFPPPDGFAAVVVGDHVVRLFWIDPNRDRLLGSDDVLWITGDRAPLPAATTFRFTLTTESGSTQGIGQLDDGAGVAEPVVAVTGTLVPSSLGLRTHKMGSVVCLVVAQSPGPPSVPLAPGPPTQPPPYAPSPPFPPYPYYPVPRRDTLPLVLIIVLVVLVLVPVVFAAILYVMVADLTRPTGETSPQVTFSSVTQDCPAGCSATISVTGVSSTLPARDFLVSLRAGPNASNAVAMPATGGGFASLPVGGATYRVYWTDLSADGHLNPGDAFRVTGNNVPLTPATSFTFYLLWSADGTYIQSASWTTPNGGGSKPLVTFTAVSQDGNATFSVASATPAVFAGNYRVNLRAGTATGTAVAMPTTSGSYATLVISGTAYRIYWVDLGGERDLNAGDQFRVTGNNAPLQAATQYRFSLIWAADGSEIQSVTWTTP